MTWSDVDANVPRRLADQLPQGLDQTSSQLFNTQHVHKEFSAEPKNAISLRETHQSAKKKLNSPQTQKTVGARSQDTVKVSTFLSLISVILWCRRPGRVWSGRQFGACFFFFFAFRGEYIEDL